MVRQRVEKLVICGCKVQRIQQMLKDLPFKLLECSFDDLCNMRPGVVMKKYGLALSMGSLQSNSLIYAMYLGYVELLVDCGIPFKHFPVHHALPVLPNVDHGLPWMEVRCNSWFWHISTSYPFLSLLHIYIQAPFLICADLVQKALFVTTCCSMAGEMLRNNLKAIFFVVFAKLIRHPDFQFSANPIE